MLVKFFANKQGGSVSGINYLLNHRVKDQTARVLKGDEAITKNIVSNITKKQKLCMGCLSFEEKDIDLSLKQTIIDEFETLLFGDEVAIEKFRIVKFKQSLSKRDKELNRLKSKLNNEIQKRNNWLKEQSSREPKRNSSISDIINDTICSDNFSIDMQLQPLFTEQKTQTNKSKYENLYKTKYKWQQTINDKTKIFTTRMYHDTTRARVIQRIRDKREAREREKGVIKQATQRIRELTEDTILIVRESKDLTKRIKEFKERDRYAKFFSRAIRAIIDFFEQSVASCYKRSRELISRINAMEIKQRDITMLERENYDKERHSNDKFGSMGV
ncbi:hypothetical protein [Campylobacter sp. RM16192]|uniref:hypothetical protein n=1 Tax=Campylobacter sp. RM16192 TaxID=1660080 RepID=UPI001451B036|nr:hypothetical protein [Campylobacter sp. RM16192]QCD51754.1 hypothetical protein CDOMC_0080 [Campylobacter sp. RM16192]